MKVYLAGPMRGIPGFNYPAFMAAARALEDAGLEVFNPAQNDIDAGFDLSDLTGHEDLSAMGFSLGKALGADLAYICSEADAVVLLPGWENSKGASAEVATALALGLLVWEFSPRAELWDDLLDDYDPVPSLVARGVMSGPVAAHDRARARREARQAGEVRVTSETGGEKGTKPARFDLLPPGALWQVAELYRFGATKYADHNWRRGYAWSLSFAAMMRHAWLFWQGEDMDDETGLPHLTSVVFHALTLLTFMVEHPAYDDRFRRPE